jgi:hypothetical protein
MSKIHELAKPDPQKSAGDPVSFLHYFMDPFIDSFLVSRFEKNFFLPFDSYIIRH